MRAHDFTAARELPVTSWSEWDSIKLVRSAMRELETGSFVASAQIVDAMGRDDRITGVMSTRAGALGSLPLNWEPRGDGRQKNAVSKEAEEAFEEICPDHVLTDLLHWGVMQNFGLAQLDWKTGPDRWTPRLQIFHPRFARWKWETRSYWVQTEQGELEVKPGNGQWVLFCPYGYHRGWMRARVRSLYVPWLVRQWGLRDWARNSEVHGMPIRKVVTPAGAVDEKERKAFLTEVANLGAENTIITPRVAGGGNEKENRYDVELLEAVGKSTETFEKLIEMANACIAINLLGQNLSTEVKGGSYAAAKGHLMIREDILTSDAELLAACLREQVLKPWAQYNFGSTELAPLPMWKTRAPEDRKAKGEGVKALGEGIAAIKAIGGKPDVAKMLEADEIPVTGAPDEVHVPAPGEKAPAEGAAPGAKPKAKPAQARASQTDVDLPEAAVEGQLYVDELVEDGTRQARNALQADVRDLLDLVQATDSYEELKQALVRFYEKMDRAALAKVLKKSMLLAQLAGKHYQLEEVE